MLDQFTREVNNPQQVKLLIGKTPYQDPFNDDGDVLYRYRELAADPGVEVLELLPEPGGGWLFVKPDPEPYVGMSFAVLEWHTEDDDSAYGNVIWCGWGISGPLRELRHSWFGPARDGYMFYAPLKLLAAASTALLKYFDGN